MKLNKLSITDLSVILANTNILNETTKMVVDNKSRKISKFRNSVKKVLKKKIEKFL